MNKFQKYIEIFLEENNKVNLISKNDITVLEEKHINDSLSFELFYDKFLSDEAHYSLLDIGTGGGFPAIPIAIKYSNINVVALDSIRKKINAVENIKKSLKLNNLTPICERVENIDKNFDIITTRAVSKLTNILKYALPHLKKSGYFVAYKSIKKDDEINEARPILKKYNAKIEDILNYELNVNDEIFNRSLIIINFK